MTTYSQQAQKIIANMGIEACPPKKTCAIIDEGSTAIISRLLNCSWAFIKPISAVSAETARPAKKSKSVTTAAKLRVTRDESDHRPKYLSSTEKPTKDPYNLATSHNHADNKPTTNKLWAETWNANRHRLAWCVRAHVFDKCGLATIAPKSIKLARPKGNLIYPNVTVYQYLA